MRNALSLLALTTILGTSISFAINSPNTDSQSYNTRTQASQLFYRTDGEITNKVRTSIVADKETKNATLSITTTDCMVEISGTAKSETQKQKIIALARKVKGVKLVMDEIDIEKE